ncbi:MAG: pyridoxine 5'-phosphate synthase [Acidobacteria bacterium 13_1_40CM_65_14]|nr:MAG: pyridoxine 5'-phosphate synthase [Acidobacteria bacterium 13_1_40CM_65_14]OLC79029.1 MAG: pyridoxine 5'-phosphate synthase [Acidobacteria bacterium 13_1_40CM_4_65_8]
MVKLSVNVNKVATLRNSRGGSVPSVLEAVDVCIAAGSPGITVHPRADRRHITPEDVRAIAKLLREKHPGVELNIEGDPRPELLDLVGEVRPDQCTLVPVSPGEITSQAGWRPGPATEQLPHVIERLRSRGVRISLFVDAMPDPIRWAASVGADRVELYTEPFARAFERGPDIASRSFAQYVECARLAHAVGLGVNAGHDLDLANLVLFRTLPFLDEVSIGHAIISRAVFVGLSTVVGEYLDVLSAI